MVDDTEKGNNNESKRSLEDERKSHLSEKASSIEPDNELENIKKELLTLGIEGEDLYKIRKTDSPSIRAKKRRLMQLQMFLTRKQKRKRGEHDQGYDSSIDGEQKRLIKEQDKDIKRFMDFDHNRDHDGRLDSLGERSAIRSTFEKPIEEAANRAMSIKKAASIAAGFTDKLLGNIAKMKQKAVGDLQTHYQQKQEMAAKGAVLASQQGQQPFDHSQAHMHINQTAMVEHQQGAFAEHMNTSIAEHSQTSIAEHSRTAIAEHSVRKVASPEVTPHSSHVDRISRGSTDSGISR